METFHFILKYIPFWAVPICVISAQFALLYKEKDYYKVSIAFILIGFVSFLFIIYYFWAGGGDPAVKHFMHFYQIITASSTKIDMLFHTPLS